MKVLFLTRYPVEGASSRYRVYQYLPYLREQGIEFSVSNFMSPRMYRLAFAQGHGVERFAWGCEAVLRRLIVLANYRKYDVIFLQRELLPFVQLLKVLGCRLVYDYDDALFVYKPSRYSRVASWLRRPDKTYKIFKSVDLVLAGNSYLRECAAIYNKNSLVFHAAEDTRRINMRPPHAAADKFVIGWLGSKSTEKYLQLIRPQLREVCSRIRGAVLKIVGGGEFKDDFPILHVPWSLETEIAHLHTFDAGLMPLPMEEYSKGKCGGKARIYMAAGVPAVCTGIGYNLELIRHGETGFLIHRPEQWVEILVQLACDPKLRQQVAIAARKHVEAEFSIERQAKKLCDILKSLEKHSVVN